MKNTEGCKANDKGLKTCPFCGCRMSADNQHAIYGEHKQSCYFYMVDHQNDFRFYENDAHMKMLHEAWNTRATPTKEEI